MVEALNGEASTCWCMCGWRINAAEKAVEMQSRQSILIENSDDSVATLMQAFNGDAMQ